MANLQLFVMNFLPKAYFTCLIRHIPFQPLRCAYVGIDAGILGFSKWRFVLWQGGAGAVRGILGSRQAEEAHGYLTDKLTECQLDRQIEQVSAPVRMPS